jgi:hypothetical protein
MRDRTEGEDLTEVIFGMSTSLDGFVKASNATPEQTPGEGGARPYAGGSSARFARVYLSVEVSSPRLPILPG